MTQFSIFAVDDSAQQRLLLESAFPDDFAVETFESADRCLEQLATRRPDLFLLDVEMPGIDGYELCRRIKARADTSDTPVLFISSHDDLESRLRGYDMGGEDFISKPIDVAEVRQKVAVVRRIRAERVGLAARIEESDLLSSMIMSNLDEYAVLIKFLRRLNTCITCREVAEALLALLCACRLGGAIRLRLDSGNLTLSESGENRPLEIAVMDDLSGRERIAESARRLAVNFGRVTVMINDLPRGDSDYSGRMRDHFAIAAESADAKLAALIASEAHARARADIAQAFEEVVATVADFRHRFEIARRDGSELGEEMIDDLSAAFASLALANEREEQILDIVRVKAERLRDLYDFGDRTEAALKNVSSRLAMALGQ